MYKVEYFDNNEWILRSWHVNQYIADINAEVAVQKWPKARVVYQGKVVSIFKRQKRPTNKGLILGE